MSKQQKQWMKLWYLCSRNYKEEKELQQIEEKLEKSKNSGNSAPKKTLPPELQAIFADLEKSMLTNLENK